MTSKMKANPDDASRFLDALEADGKFTFQTLPESEAAKGSRHLLNVLHGRLDEHLDTLIRLNQEGAGIFVMVNEGDGLVHDGERTCRTAGNVIRIRAAFIDLDGAPIEPVLKSVPLPTLITETSPLRWHAYWRIKNCPLEKFKGTQIALAKKFGSDPSVNDLPRIMRIPGFLHQKANPFLTRIVKIDEFSGEINAI